MPFIEDVPPVDEYALYRYSAEFYELKYNRQDKTLALVRTGMDTNPVPVRTIEQQRVAGSVSMLAQTIYHDFAMRSAPADEAAATRRTMVALAERMDNWLEQEKSDSIVEVRAQFKPDTSIADDPLRWLRALIWRSSDLVWQLFLPYFCSPQGTTGSDELDESILRMFVMMRLQATSSAFIDKGPNLDTPYTESRWIEWFDAIEEVTACYDDVDDSQPRALQHKEIVEGMIGKINNLGSIDHFVHSVDPAILSAAFVKAVEAVGLSAADEEDETVGLATDDEEVVMLADLVLAVAVFDIGLDPMESNAVMHRFTRAADNLAVRDAIQARARQFSVRTVAEPFRSRLSIVTD